MTPPRVYRHKITRRRYQVVRFRTKKDRGPLAIQYGVFTLVGPMGGRHEVTGDQLRNQYERVEEKP